MKKLFILGSLLLFYFFGQAQFTRYIIRFKDKQFNSYSISNPSQFLSQRALDRRARYNIAIDSTDLPVTSRYIDSLRLSGSVTILNVSKWLNQVAIQTTDAAALSKISAFPFVVSSQPVASVITNPIIKPLTPQTNNIDPPALDEPVTSSLTSFGYGYSNGQVKIHQGNFLHDHGFRGEGMQLAVLDAGFYHYLTLPTFDSARQNNQILGTWNFVNNSASVNDGDVHGMECLSTIAANLPGTFIGTSPKTSFYLFVTEDISSESIIEEQNWAAGLEKADSLGVNVCSTSLGYTQFDNASTSYTYADMNGHTTLSAKAANIASKKGMLLVVAAGNEGTNTWHYLDTPADADSVLAVGAIDTTGLVASFSSYGPSSDGDIKPGVASVGLNTIVANPYTGMPMYNSGTSFACPNMAGLVSCLWQAYPEINGRGIINAIETTASKYNNPDNRVGYGIPDMKKAFVLLFKKLYTQQLSIIDCKPTLKISAKTDNSFTITVERKLADENNFSSVQLQAGAGSFSQQTFTFNDDLSNEVIGNISYRILVKIGTDTSFYMDPVNIDYTQQCAASENKIYITPNPVTDFLNIKTERVNAAKASLIIQNIAGQKVYAGEINLLQGTNLQRIPMRSYSKGMYVISVIIDGKKIISEKILKQ